MPCFSCCPSPPLPLAPSHCLASFLCVHLFPHSTSLVGGCRLLQCFAAYLREGRLDLIMFNCVYPCLGDWDNFCSRSTASCGLRWHEATRDNVCPWANVCLGKEAHLTWKVAVRTLDKESGALKPNRALASLCDLGYESSCTSVPYPQNQDNLSSWGCLYEDATSSKTM